MKDREGVESHILSPYCLLFVLSTKYTGKKERSMSNLHTAAAATTSGARRRRRRRRERDDNDNHNIDSSSFSYSTTATFPMDSDDQARLVVKMTAELQQQQRAILHAFRIVCWGAAAVSILCAWLVQLRANNTRSSSGSSGGVFQQAHATRSSSSSRSSSHQNEHQYHSLTVLLRWIHAVMAATLHGVVASYLATTTTTTTTTTTDATATAALPSFTKWILYLPFAIMLLVAACSLFLLRYLAAAAAPQPQGDIHSSSYYYYSSHDDYYYFEESIWLHQGMLLANVLTAAAGLWLRYDHHSMNQSLEELKTSQYRYKSL